MQIKQFITITAAAAATTTATTSNNNSSRKKWNGKHRFEGEWEEVCGDAREEGTSSRKEVKIADLKPIKSLDQHNAYKFQGVFENTKQEDKQVLEAAAKT